MMINRYLLITLVIFTFSCSSGNEKTATSESEAAEATQPEEADSQETAAERVLNPVLLGEWRSADDPKSGLEFTEEQMTMTYDGAASSSEPYILANQCRNESDSDTPASDQPKYISAPESDMCWYIISVDEDELKLSYVGRGNTLSYIRAGSEETEEFQTMAGELQGIDETGIYGLWSLSVAAPGGTRNFNYETENMTTVSDMLGQLVDVKYTETSEQQEVDILVDGKSIYGDYGTIKSDEDIDPDWSVITGTLSAENLSGDTPDPISVSSSEGEEVAVVTFVTQLHLDLSGKEVTLYYRDNAFQQVKSISISEDISDEDQVLFIREKFGVITQNTDDYYAIEFEVEQGGGFVQYERQMEGNTPRKLVVAYCSDHGCDKTSYYFWAGQVIFRFEESSFWTGQTDNVAEKRTYYRGEKDFRCLEKSLSGSNGYDAAKAELANQPNEEIDCANDLDRDNINGLLALTESSAQEYFGE